MTKLTKLSEKRPLFLYSYPINDLILFERLCQKVYFPTRAVSTGDVAAMHGILYFVMREFSSRNDDICEQFDLKNLITACKQSFEADLKRYDVHAVSSFENAIALTMGILKAQDEAKPLAGCYLLSAAVRHCQVLGYHRELTYRKDPDGNAHSKRRLFWTLYVTDKKMSLLLGRASYIQDHDIDAAVPVVSSDPAIRPWDEAFGWMIKFARIEGRIYDELYSAVACTIPSPERSQRMHALKAAMEECRRGRDEVGFSEPDIYGLSSKTWDVLYYSTLTTLLRATCTPISGAEINPECYAAARRGLESHLQCFPGYANSEIYTVADYANWVLLFSSLTPVIVIFLHAISTTSTENVELLEHVVSTLRPTRGVSSVLERLYSICENLGRVARGLLESRKCTGVEMQGKPKPGGGARRTPDKMRTSPELPSGVLSDSLEAEFMSYLTYPQAQHVSGLLNSWDAGHPSVMDLLGVDT
ncbi:hypothetical protein BO99DRAFT_453747 [Aspergillus violaceofuscus CBS 115571]|uniref:Xylanolytic transcriptional activator regulatory domain-containing protein n=1 Tax=Aspergillus violaceofuscus (strain CBS 115571) TaxID=1450538 RepID=A0A2V5GR17_ASPV1|nr:hypothetical protein BO99DRAFT_453747 [Aspergillus violaceofuscus CBS 115571]